MKCRKLITLICIGTIVLTGCVSYETKQKAKEYANQYESEFTEKVENDYGDDTTVKNIKGVITQTKNKDTDETVYTATGDLEGNIIKNGKKYDAIYHPVTKKMESTAYNETIKEELINTLPLDRTKIIYTNLTDKYNKTPMFDSTIKTLDGAAVSKCDMYLYIITDETINPDLQNKIKDIDQLKRIEHGSSNCKITIVSVSDKDKIEQLKKNIHEYDFSSDTIPTARTADTAENIFSFYHISNTCYITFTNGSMKSNFLTK